MKWGILQAQPAQLLQAARVLKGTAVCAPQGQPDQFSQQTEVHFGWSCFQPGLGAQPAQFMQRMKELEKSLCLSDTVYTSLFQQHHLAAWVQILSTEHVPPANPHCLGEYPPKRKQSGWQQACVPPSRCPPFHEWQTAFFSQPPF